MNDTSNKALWALGSIAVAIGLVALFHIGAVRQATDGVFGTIAAGITNYSGISITGTPGTFDVSGSMTQNGAATVTQRSTMTTATTTICALSSPAATSTLTFASAYFTVSTSTASTVTIAKATTAYATTTSLLSTSLAANAQGTIVFATSTTATTGLDPNFVFAPSTYMVVGMAGGTGTFSPTGVCQATFRQVN